jgi:hypothetical protein
MFYSSSILLCCHGNAFVTIRCRRNKCLPNRCLANDHIRHNMFSKWCYKWQSAIFHMCPQSILSRKGRAITQAARFQPRSGGIFSGQSATGADIRFVLATDSICRSQWPRGLRHGPSSAAQTQGSWVRIQIEAWLSVCVSVFVSSYV